jgi:hypothetical protein
MWTNEEEKKKKIRKRRKNRSKGNDENEEMMKIKGNRRAHVSTRKCMVIGLYKC